MGLPRIGSVKSASIRAVIEDGIVEVDLEFGDCGR